MKRLKIVKGLVWSRAFCLKTRLRSETPARQARQSRIMREGEINRLNKELIVRLNKLFEDSAYEADGVEYWLARDLQVLLEYTQWRNFELVIEKAKVSCQTAGQNPIHHFAGVSKTIPMPKGAATLKNLSGGCEPMKSDWADRQSS